MAWPDAEQLLAHAIQYLMHGGDRDNALLLLSCEADYDELDEGINWFSLALTGPREVYEALQFTPREEFRPSLRAEDESSRAEAEWNAANAPYLAVVAAFRAVAPLGSNCGGFGVKVKYDDIQPGWRERLLDEVHGRRVHNQGVEFPGSNVVEWETMRFRSQTELRVARALDIVGVLFLPNCRARLDKGNRRITQEADFLVCQNGKWGILEADGGPYHQQAARDHDRDRLFRQHGIKVIERFTAEECYNDAPGVVRKFLTLLEKNG